MMKKELSFLKKIHSLLLYRRVAAGVRGFIDYDCAELLYFFAFMGPGKGEIVEIGSAWGRSTIILATASKRAGREKVWAVDPHTGGKKYLEELGAEKINSYPEFLQNIAKFKINDWICPIVKTSEEAAREWGAPIRLLWIDGWHTYEAVKNDFNCWFPFIVEGGVIIFDDYLNPAFPDYKKGIDTTLNPNIVKWPLQIIGHTAYTFKKN